MLQDLTHYLQGFGLTPLSLMAMGVGLGAMLLIYGIAGATAARDPVLRRIAGQSIRPRNLAVDAGLLRPQAGEPKGLMKSLVPTDKRERTQIARQLAEAGMNGPHAVRNFYLMRVGIGLGLPLALMAAVSLNKAGMLHLPDAISIRLLGMTPLMQLEILAMLVAAGFFGPAFWLNARVAARRQAIQDAFPNVLDLLQISVESGLGMDAAMIRVANETEKSAPEISEELLIAQREIQAGRPREKALMEMGERTGVDEVTSFASVVLQSIQFGASISDALATYAEEMRTARELRAQERANQLPVKMSAVLATLLLPSLIIVALGPVVIRYIRYHAGG